MTTFLLFVITILVALIGWGAKTFFTWTKTSVSEHIIGEDNFRKFVKDEIKTINESMDFFIKELKPSLDKVNKIPKLEEKIDEIEIDIRLLKQHTKFSELN